MLMIFLLPLNTVTRWKMIDKECRKQALINWIQKNHFTEFTDDMLKEKCPYSFDIYQEDILEDMWEDDLVRPDIDTSYPHSTWYLVCEYDQDSVDEGVVDKIGIWESKIYRSSENE